MDRGVVLQLLGAVALVVGVLVQFGVGWSLIVVAAVLLAYGFLLEREKVREQNGSGSPPRT